MYIVTVEITVRPSHLAEFRREMLGNARASRNEPGCRQFDVGESSENPGQVFLYEVYDDRAAFDLHRTTAHFVAFQSATGHWIEQKVLRSYVRIDPA